MKQVCRITGILVVLFIHVIVFGQSPYDHFDDKQKTKHTYSLSEMIFRAESVDTTDIIRYVELDIETLFLKCFSANDSLVAEVQLEQGDVKFINRDPKFEKYFWVSPYAYCINNPVKYIDPTGMDVDVTSLVVKDKHNGTNNIKQLTTSLSAKTGLNVDIESNQGKTYLCYDHSGDGNLTCSEEARDMLMGAIDDKRNTVEVFQVKDGQGSQGGGNQIGLDFSEIRDFLKGSYGGLNPETMGAGMVFLHELDHTVLGAGTKHSKSEKAGMTIGTTVQKMNLVRNQLGSDYGQRLSYPGVTVGNQNCIPFNTTSKSDLKRINPKGEGMFIRY